MDLGNVRLDNRVVYDVVEPGSKVLDLGCGDGDLLSLLTRGKNVKGQGIELDERSIYQCVEKGLSVFHSDIDSGLPDYPDKSFDYVILNQSLQQVKRVEFVLKEALRVGRKVIVGFPNFASLQARVNLFFLGRAPISSSLPYHWYDTPNTHFLSLKDFKNYCIEKGIRILGSYYLGKRYKIKLWPNLLALNAVFVIAEPASSKG